MVYIISSLRVSSEGESEFGKVVWALNFKKQGQEQERGMSISSQSELIFETTLAPIEIHSTSSKTEREVDEAAFPFNSISISKRCREIYDTGTMVIDTSSNIN